jgi:hypothetical protein
LHLARVIFGVLGEKPHHVEHGNHAALAVRTGARESLFRKIFQKFVIFRAHAAQRKIGRFRYSIHWLASAAFPAELRRVPALTIPLSTPTVSRERLHGRTLAYDGYRRNDGLFDIEAHILDVEDHGGVNSGFMIAQVTAAALASENKSLAHPASVDSLPTSANQEDHVSMATYAARRLGPMAANTAGIVAIELLAATQGVELRKPLATSPRLTEAMALIRERVAFWERDRAFAPDLAAARELVEGGAFLPFVGPAQALV